MNTLEYQVGPPLPISIEIDNVTTEKKIRPLHLHVPKSAEWPFCEDLVLRGV
jgi:hypothetical protein